ncbi:unnamed protein product [Rotaria sordida]|uniref:Uncharacterized protein n=1 Tax=Rotaria sordida TaxID=392033 RepID=A0A815LBE7_9BILA|nr:unnamed protein product [Rotaria sordida]
MIEETMPDYDISSHFIYTSGHELETHALAALEPVDQSLLNIYSTQLTLFDVVSSFELRPIDPFVVAFRASTIRNDQSLLDIYSTQLTLFDVVSSFKLRPIDPFVVAFRASTIRNLNNFEKILNDFRQSLVHDETVYCLDIFSYLTSLNEYFKLLL